MHSDEYDIKETSYEVWKAIKQAHPNLKVFGSFTDFDDDRGRVFTSYGFEGASFPVMQAYSTWDEEPHEEYEYFRKRVNEEHHYWLCLPKKCEEC